MTCASSTLTNLREDAIHHPLRYPLGRDSSADLEARGLLGT